MRLVEFLVHLLEAHAQTLQRLAALFGEERLLEMLETAGEKADEARWSGSDAPPPPPPLENPNDDRHPFDSTILALKRPRVSPIENEKIGTWPVDWFEVSPSRVSGSTYAELEGAVQEMNLPEFLEFYLWAYPHYRAFIESPLDLDSRIRGAGSDAGLALVEEAMAQAEQWIRSLPIPPAISQQAERAAQIPWLRFRANVLKRIGKRPLGPVY